MITHCPQCQQSISIEGAVPPKELVCSSCGSAFVEANADTVTVVLDGTERTYTYVAKRPAGGSTNETSDAADRIGNYELLNEIARGGMGVVYKARQISLNRVVALKMIKSGELAGDDEVRRFRAEAEAAARLDHPSIVPVYEVGEQNGRHFFSMGFVEGVALDRRLKDGPLPPREAAQLIATIAEAVHYAHENAIIHRDLKPGNVLIDQDGKPRVTDFGLAKHVAEESGLTATGQIMGTPSYMPPEQATGRVKDVGRSADVYSLGAMLYALLTGRPPFQAANVVETLKQVCDQDPVSPKVLNAAVDRDLETICLKCLAKAPERRYQDAGSLAAELRRFLDGQPIHARPVGLTEKAAKWVRRRPAVAFLLSLVALAAALLLVGGAYFTARLAQRNREISEGKQRVEIALGNVTEQRNKADRARQSAEYREYVSNIRLAKREWEQGNAGPAREALERCAPELRDWEYHYLNALFHHGQRTIGWHDAWVTCVCSSPDGRTVASAAWDGAVCLWDAVTGAERTRLHHSSKGASAIGYAPDGRSIVTAGFDGKVRIWDTATGTLRHVLAGHNGFIYGVAVSPDGQRIGRSGQDKTIRIWDFSGRERLTIRRAKSLVRSVAFSPDGKRIAAATITRLLVCDATTGAEVFSLPNSGGSGTVAFSPDGQRLATSDQKGVKIWDMQRGVELKSFQMNSHFVASVAFSPDGTRIVSAGNDRVLTVWNAADGAELFQLVGHSEEVTSVAFTADGQHIISGGKDYSVKIWNAARGPEESRLQGESSGAGSVSIRPDGKQLARGGFRNVQTWDVRTGKELSSWAAHEASVSAVCYGPDGRRIASAGDNTVKIWDAEKYTWLLTLSGHQEAVNDVCFTPDGTKIISGSGDQTIKVWDAASGNELLSLESNEAVNCVCTDGRSVVANSAEGVSVWDLETGKHLFNLPAFGLVLAASIRQDGKRIACGVGSTIKIWDAATQKELHTLRGHTERVTGLQFTPSGTRILSSSGDGTVKIWDPLRGAELLTLRGHETWASSVALSADGNLIASGSDRDSSVKVWSARTPTDLRPLYGHSDSVAALCFSPDGSRLASGGNDQTLRIWDVDSGQERFRYGGHSGPVWSVSFDPNGRRVVSADRKNVVIIRNAANGERIATLSNMPPMLGPVRFDTTGVYVIMLVGDERYFWNSRTGKRVNGQGLTAFPVSRTTPDERILAIPEGNQIQLVDLKLRARSPDWLTSSDNWHARRLEEAHKSGQWFAVAFHAGRLLRSRPRDSALHVLRSYAFHRAGMQQDAVVSYLQALLIQPGISPWPQDEHAYDRAYNSTKRQDWATAVHDFRLATHQGDASLMTWYRLLLSQLAAGQTEDARHTTVEMISRFGQTQDLKARKNVLFCSILVLAPDDVAKWQLAVAAQLIEQKRDRSALLHLGRAQYRAAKYAEAVKSLQESNRLSTGSGYPEARIFMAMAEHELGHAEKAEALLTRAEEEFRKTKYDDWQWKKRIRTQVLIRELKESRSLKPESR